MMPMAIFNGNDRPLATAGFVLQNYFLNLLIQLKDTYTAAGIDPRLMLVLVGFVGVG